MIVLPFATQIKHKSRTPIHDGPLKAEVTFCVQGVISPLLANLFLKTKIVYCKDANRGGDFPNQSFDFLGFTFRARKALGRERRAFACFLPAASPKPLTSISRTVRCWALHHRSDKSLQDLAEMYNPCIRGWINYYSHFYKTQLRPTYAE